MRRSDLRVRTGGREDRVHVRTTGGVRTGPRERTGGVSEDRSRV